MVNELANLLREKNVLVYNKSGIPVCKVAGTEKGFDLASDILSSIVDKRSVLYLSGGTTPKGLYAKLATSNVAGAKEERLEPGAVALVDERYGPPSTPSQARLEWRAGEKLHENSNEKMIRDSGFLRYLEMLDIPFYPILQKELSREQTAAEYDDKLRSLQSTFPKHIGILGIGEDGHTAGIPAKFSIFNFQFSISKIYKSADLVGEYNDESGRYGERVTMTFMGLSMLDILLVLVFGSPKANALKLVFDEGSEEEAPGRFYKRPEIARKTLLITDQEV